MTSYKEGANNPSTWQTNRTQYDFFQYPIYISTSICVTAYCLCMLDFILTFEGFPTGHQNEFGKISMPRCKLTDMSTSRECLKVVMIRCLIIGL